MSARDWLLTLFLFIVAASMVVVLISFVINDLVTQERSTQGFVIAIGALFTFASLILALFGIVNYFHSSETLRRFSEVEFELRASLRERIVMRTFMSLLSIPGIVGRIGNMVPSGVWLVHLIRIAFSKDVPPDGPDDFELGVTFIQIMNAGGLDANRASTMPYFLPQRPRSG